MLPFIQSCLLILIFVLWYCWVGYSPSRDLLVVVIDIDNWTTLRFHWSFIPSHPIHTPRLNYSNLFSLLPGKACLIQDSRDTSFHKININPHGCHSRRSLSLSKPTTYVVASYFMTCNSKEWYASRSRCSRWISMVDNHLTLNLRNWQLD